MNFMGKDDEKSPVVKETLKELVCSLYQAKLETDVNEARYKSFTKEKETTTTSVFVTDKRSSVSAY